MEDAIAMVLKLLFDFQHVRNAHLIIDLVGLVLLVSQNNLISFDREYFQQIFVIIMGTSVAPKF